MRNLALFIVVSLIFIFGLNGCSLGGRGERYFGIGPFLEDESFIKERAALQNNAGVLEVVHRGQISVEGFDILEPYQISYFGRGFFVEYKEENVILTAGHLLKPLRKDAVSRFLRRFRNQFPEHISEEFVEYVHENLQVEWDSTEISFRVGDVIYHPIPLHVSYSYDNDDQEIPDFAILRLTDEEKKWTAGMKLGSAKNLKPGQTLWMFSGPVSYVGTDYMRPVYFLEHFYEIHKVSKEETVRRRETVFSYAGVSGLGRSGAPLMVYDNQQLKVVGIAVSFIPSSDDGSISHFAQATKVEVVLKKLDEIFGSLEK